MSSNWKPALREVGALLGVFTVFVGIVFVGAALGGLLAFALFTLSASIGRLLGYS